MKKGLNILVLFDTAGTPPDDQNFDEELKTGAWKTENDIINALKNLGCDVHTLGIYEEIDLLYEAIKKVCPDIVFNLTEHFGGKGHLDKAVVGLFEMMGVKYTGCGSAGLMLCRHKALSKKLVSFHRIKNPEFFLIKKNRNPRIPERLMFPYIVKKANDDASEGISRASLVGDMDALVERVKFVHNHLGDDALVESFVPGRELYVSVIGNNHLQVLPVREIVFRNVEDASRAFATYKTKWDEGYRKKWGIENVFAKNVPEDVEKKIVEQCKKIYKILKIDGYARIDLRLTPNNEIVFIEANPNPYLAKDEDFALSAKRAGLEFPQLLEKIISLGMNRAC